MLPLLEPVAAAPLIKLAIDQESLDLIGLVKNCGDLTTTIATKKHESSWNKNG